MKPNRLKVLGLLTALLASFLFPKPLQAGDVITINIKGEVAGKTIRALLGVNGGPVKNIPDNPNSIDLVQQYKDVGIASIRIHDLYQGNAENFLDTSYIYPDSSKNPELNSSYNFAEGDRAFRSILQSGFEIYFRLGNSWGSSYNKEPVPENVDNWIKAAVHIVDHYYQLSKSLGKPLKYIEIWNEPDNSVFWDKPFFAYFDLYSRTAKAIKSRFPELKVGGPAFTPMFALTEKGKERARDFLRYVKDKGAPLDFFSWHMYSNKPEDYENGCKVVKELLAEFGFSHAESHVTEYNIELKQSEDIFLSAESASLTTAFWITMQKEGVSQAFYYRGNDPDTDRPWVGLFWVDGKYKPTAYAFALWSRLVPYGSMLDLEITNNDGLFVIAGKNSSSEVAVLVANTTGSSKNYSLNISGVDLAKLSVNICELSEKGDSLETRSASANALQVKPFGVQFLTFKKQTSTVLVLKVNDKYMLVNGQKQEIDPGRGTVPIIKNGRTLVPIRAIVEALGGTVGWDGTEKKVTIKLSSTTIELWIGRNRARVNGTEKQIDRDNPSVVPEIINSRTMLPLRFVTENLGCTVEWDGTTKTITIEYKGG